MQMKETMFDYLLEDVDESAGLPLEVTTTAGDEQMHRVPLRDKVKAAARTSATLAVMGEVHKPTPENVDRAQELFETAGTPTKYDLETPAVVMRLDALLTEYDHAIIRDADQIRQYVTNRLLEESDNDDARIRMRAFEMLGKISDVGLFTEKREITVNDQSDESLQNTLKEKLRELMNENVIDVTPGAA